MTGPQPLSVTHLGGDRFAVHVRGHQILADQPVEDGGEDSAPTPTELFVAGLASCVAFYARRYLRRHELAEQGLAVRAEYSLAPRPARVDRVALELTLPDGFPPERTAALLAVAEHCTVHNTLHAAPDVELRLTG